MNFEKHYLELMNVYNNLRKANEDFLTNNSGPEEFGNLVSLRSNLFDNMDIIKENLLNELNSVDIAINYNKMDLAEILNELPNHFSELIYLRNQLAEALQQLMVSEKNTSEFINTLYDDLKKQLQYARKSKQTLNAYKPVSGYDGSYFIDSKK